MKISGESKLLRIFVGESDKIGAVPVIVDPGMGIQRMLQCLQESDPQAFIGIPKAHVLRKVYPKFFKTVNTYITVGRKWFWAG